MNYQSSSFSDNIQKVIKNASKFALRFGSNLIGSEHILYGLVSVKDCLAARLLGEYEVNESSLFSFFEENINANTFRRMAIFLPRYFISIGIVIIPTVVSVDTNTAICTIPAPFFISSATMGNAIITGTIAIAPTNEVRSIPVNPVSLPITRFVVSGESTASTTPAKRRMATNCGKTPANNFHAFFKDNSVLCLSLTKETISETAAKP